MKEQAIQAECPLLSFFGGPLKLRSVPARWQLNEAGEWVEATGAPPDSQSNPDWRDWVPSEDASADRWEQVRRVGEGADPCQ